MKKFAAIILSVALLSVTAVAQSRVETNDILKSIDEGTAVEYRDVTVVGDLDLTKLKDMTPDKDNKRSRNSSNTFWYHVRSPLKFIDCTFQDDVIAYYHDDKKNETHNAVFHADALFTGCEFQGKSAFKYSTFHEGADFSKTSYRKEALFKYTKFRTEVSFSGSTFANDANFKYTEFPKNADFSGVEFEDLANFKYTEFPRGVSFKNAVFQGDANFKYTKFSEPFDFEDTEFEDSADFKYTKLEGKSFTLYLLKNKK
ncbi:MAG: pentapeptide repeat-containing protein [Candidatus Aminicenantaceae bacterium]